MISYNEWHIIQEAVDRKTCKKLLDLGKISFEPALADKHIETKEYTRRIYLWLHLPLRILHPLERIAGRLCWPQRHQGAFAATFCPKQIRTHSRRHRADRIRYRAPVYL